MILEDILALPWNCYGKQDSVRNHIWRYLMENYEGGWYKGGKEDCSTGTLFFGALAVMVPDHPITPDEVESCIYLPLCQFCTLGSRDDVHSMEDLLKIWEKTGALPAATPPDAS